MGFVKPGRILVVDDQPEVLDLVKSFLRHGGHDVAIAESGQEALELLADQSFDLAIVDLQMPGMDGFQLCAKIREQERGGRLPILFLTAHYDEKEWSVRSRELGADDFVLKPITRRALLARVGALLRLVRESGPPRGQVEALRAFFEAALEGVPACILAIDEYGLVVGATGQVVETLGRGVALGEPLDRAVPTVHAAREALRKLADSVVDGQAEASKKIALPGATGIRNLRATARRVPAISAGSPIRVILVIEDTDASAGEDKDIIDIGPVDIAAAAADIASAIQGRSNDVITNLRVLGEAGERILRLAEMAGNAPGAGPDFQLQVVSLRAYWRRALKESALGVRDIVQMARSLRGGPGDDKPPVVASG